MAKKVLSIFFFTVWVPFQLLSQDSLSMEEAIKIGLENNYNIKYANTLKQQSENNNSIGNAGFLPVVGAEGFYSRRIENTNQQFLDGRSVIQDNAKSNSLSASIGLNWFVFDGTRMFVTKERLEQLESISELNVDLNVSNALAEIINAYNLLVAEQKTLNVYEKLMHVSQERLRITNVALELGSIAGIEAMKAQVDFNSDQSLYLNQQVRVKNAMADLNQLMGRAVELEFVASDSIYVEEELMYDELLMALESNPNLSILRKNIKVAELQRKEIKAERFPLIGITSSYNYLESESESGFVRSNEVQGLTYGANVFIPIFNGFDIKRRQFNSEILIKQNKIEFDKSYSLIKQDFITHYRNYQNNLQMIGFEEKSVYLARENMLISLRNFELGGISSLELREIQQSYLEAEERLIRTIYQAKASETELLRLSNQLMVQQ